ncbi:hypothetical protein M422DRAFT_247761 [Sphaerobolus stellatus SS14]|nr:hypothetical protein M422DRAFT_247761 [Sphaerobolus stellatus SS14]
MNILVSKPRRLKEWHGELVVCLSMFMQVSKPLVREYFDFQNTTPFPTHFWLSLLRTGFHPYYVGAALQLLKDIIVLEDSEDEHIRLVSFLLAFNNHVILSREDEGHLRTLLFRINRDNDPYTIESTLLTMSIVQWGRQPIIEDFAALLVKGLRSPRAWVRRVTMQAAEKYSRQLAKLENPSLGMQLISGCFDVAVPPASFATKHDSAEWITNFVKLAEVILRQPHWKPRSRDAWKELNIVPVIDYVLNMSPMPPNGHEPLIPVVDVLYSLLHKFDIQEDSKNLPLGHSDELGRAGRVWRLLSFWSHSIFKSDHHADCNCTASEKCVAPSDHVATAFSDHPNTFKRAVEAVAKWTSAVVHAHDIAHSSSVQAGSTPSVHANGHHHHHFHDLKRHIVSILEKISESPKGASRSVEINDLEPAEASDLELVESEDLEIEEAEDLEPPDPSAHAKALHEKVTAVVHFLDRLRALV